MFNRSTSKFLFDLIKLEPQYSIYALCLALSITFLNLMGTILLIPILYTLIGNQEGFILPQQFKIINNIFAGLNPNQTDFGLPLMLIVLLLIIVIKNIIDYASIVLNFKHNKVLVYKLKVRAFNLLSQVNLSYHQRNKNGDTLIKINREIDNTVLVVKNIQKIVIISLILLIHLAILCFISWQLTLLTFIVLSAIVWLNNLLVLQVQRRKNIVSDKLQLYNYQLIEFLTGMRLIKTVANEFGASQTITKSLENKDQAQLQTQLIAATIKPTIEVSITLLILAIISYYLATPAIFTSAASLFTYLIVFCRLLPFLVQFNQARLQVIQTRDSVPIVAKFLTESTKQITLPGKVNFSHLETGIKFEEITFAYPQHARIILDKICLQIPQGKTTALVSFSRLEQSIIADLLTRLHEPIAGRILFDNRELQEYNPQSLRKAIAIVNHHPFLFNNSLADNISYGVDGVTQADLVKAAKQARIYQFIEQLPAGFATEIGRGIALSEEQKQGISLARAFLRNPKIVVIQEPIVTPDSVSAILEHLCPQRTIIIMTTQLDLVQQADQIMVFHQGKIQEVGTHEQLLQPGTIYQRLYTRQFKSSQQDRQLKLARKIANKLAQQTQRALSPEIQRHYHALLNHLELISAGLINDEPSQKKILDQSSQSAKDLLTSLKEYERLIARKLDLPDY